MKKILLLISFSLFSFFFAQENAIDLRYNSLLNTMLNAEKDVKNFYFERKTNQKGFKYLVAHFKRSEITYYFDKNEICYRIINRCHPNVAEKLISTYNEKYQKYSRNYDYAWIFSKKGIPRYILLARVETEDGDILTFQISNDKPQ